MNKIHIFWRGPFSLEEAKKEAADNYGLYQYYGGHPIYGVDALLYIGRAAFENPIEKRLKDHVHENWSSIPIQIFIGNIISEKRLTDIIWNKHIELAEELLIYSHGPAWNSSNIKSIKYEKFKTVHIFNWGHRAKLLPEVSYERWGGWGNSKPDELHFQNEF